ncbi:hypothetical protein BSLG_007466 [Batrachochytrium salamandrivorans]|nr:hypothetical protein BSLG_007466 [Batrachochytrium salamandrivorans]
MQGAATASVNPNGPYPPTPPTGGGYPQQPLQQQPGFPQQQPIASYSAYPEYNPQSHVVGGRSYQGAVAGMSGWNDPPKLTADADAAEKILAAAGGSPEGVIVASFTAAMDLARGLLDRMPNQRQKVEDTDRRIDGLFDRLASQQIQPQRTVLAQLLQLAQALDKKEYTAAQTTVMKMMTSNYANETSWILGAKRLVELLMMLG